MWFLGLFVCTCRGHTPKYIIGHNNNGNCSHAGGLSVNNYDHKNNVVENSSILVRVFGTRVRGFMVDYHIKITIYIEIRESESITWKKSTLCILSTEAIDPLCKNRFNRSKNFKFSGQFRA